MKPRKPPKQKMTSAELFELCQEIAKGSSHAFKTFMEIKRKESLAYLRSRFFIVGERAATICNDYFMRVRDSLKRGNLKHDENVDAWLKGILYSVAIEDIRKKSRRKQRVISVASVEEELLKQDLVNLVIEEKEDFEDSPTKQIIKLAELLEKNHPRCAELFKLRYIEGLNDTEIAEEMNYANEQVVKVRWTKCKSTLITLTKKINKNDAR